VNIRRRVFSSLFIWDRSLEGIGAAHTRILTGAESNGGARKDYFEACGPSLAVGVALKGNRHRRLAALSSNPSCCLSAVRISD
jgi:hypothetical protein